MNKLTHYKVINYLMFQLGWLACVWGAGQGLPWLGPVAVLPMVALHLRWAIRPQAETRLLLLCAVSGLAFDSLLLATGWLSYPSGSWLPGLAPYWLVAMWLLFGSTLNLSMGWMRGRPIVALLLGATGGPLAYFAGQKLGAIEISQPWQAGLALATGWGVLMPALATVATRLDGFTSQSSADFSQLPDLPAGASNHV